MEFKEVITISGMQGLYQLVNSKSDGMIVKSLEDGKTQFVSSRIHGVSALETISVFLKNEETTDLKKVFQEMKKKEAGTTLPDGKGDAAKLKEYFKTVIPDYDEEKVHVSDMKKMVKWYGILKQHDLIPQEEIAAEESGDSKDKAETGE